MTSFFPGAVAVMATVTNVLGITSADITLSVKQQISTHITFFADNTKLKP